MTSTTRGVAYNQDRPPVAGERFRKAARLPIDGAKRRKLFCLIAAYQDAGAQPSIRELGERLGLAPHRWRRVEQLLYRLERDGWLTIERGDCGRKERNRYTLNLDRGNA